MRKAFVGVLLTVLLGLCLVSAVYASQDYTWLAGEFDGAITETLSATQEQISVTFTFHNLAVNTSASSNYAEYRIGNNATHNLVFALKADGETYYITDSGVMVATGLTLDTAVNYENSTITMTVTNGKLKIVVDDETVLSGYNISDDPEANPFSTVEFATDFSPNDFYTAGYIDVKVYTSETSSILGSLIGVIIMVSVVSILIGAVKANRR